MEEKNTTLMGQILWCGFKTETIYYIRKKRDVGKSRWTISKKVKLFLDSVLSFSYFPIRFISLIGLLFASFSFLWLIYILIAKLTINISTPGWTTLILVVLFAFGLMFITLGIIGEYLWRTFDASRSRPVFIIDEIIEKNDNNK